MMKLGPKTWRATRGGLAVWLMAVMAGLFCGVAGASDAGAQEPAQAQAQPLAVHFFYTPGCPSCEPTKQAVAAAEKKFGSRIAVVRHSINDSSLSADQNQKNYGAFILALDHYGRKDTPSLTVFAGTACLGGDEIIQKLDITLELLLRDKAVTPDFKPFGIEDAQKLVALTQERTSIWLVMGAGFADGFNPCAFATVILFVSMLSGVGRERRTILAVGLSFVAGVFLVYVAIGLAFFKMMTFFDSVPALSYVGLGIKWFSLALVVVAGALSLYDAVRAFRSGGKAKMLLVLPESLKDRIRKRLRVTAHGSSLVLGAFVSGIVISFLEAACTGQTYLPIISGLVSDNGTATRGYALLLLYNVLFILPLLAVFFAVFFGMTSDQIGNMMRRRVWVTKLALGAIFLAMAYWLGSLLLPTLWADKAGGTQSMGAAVEAGGATPVKPAANPVQPAHTPAAASHEGVDR